MYKILKKNSHLYIFVPTLEIDKWIKAIKEQFKLNNVISTSCYATERYFPNNFAFDSQLILFCSKGKAKNFNKINWNRTSNAWFNDKRNEKKKEYTYNYTSFIDKKYRSNFKANEQNKCLHPNQKSVKLITKFIELSSNEGDIVLDPFSGSGSTLVASKKTNRKYIGYETNEEYYDVSIERLKNVIPNNKNKMF